MIGWFQLLYKFYRFTLVIQYIEREFDEMGIYTRRLALILSIVMLCMLILMGLVILWLGK